MKKVYLSDYASFDAFYSHLKENKIDQTLFLHVVHFIGTDLFAFSQPHPDSIYLISGTLPFFNERSTWIRNKKGIFITDYSTSPRQVPPFFHRITHVKTGGVTTFAALYTYFPDQASPKTTSLRRTLGDFMDYSIPPLCIKTSQMSLTHKGLLPIKYSSRLVQYPTPFSHTGFGYRYLLPKEYITIYGLESLNLPTNIPITSFSIVPIPMLDSLLHPLLQELPREYVPPSLPLPPIYHDQKSITLPNLNKVLPDQWYQHVTKTNSAVKDDNAAVDYALWNNRIQLVFPCITVQHLNTFRYMALTSAFRTLYLEFTSYMRHKYPTYWQSQAHNGRLHTWVLQTTGGVKHRDEISFQSDINAGREVLSSYCNSSFFGWDKGSTLIFWRWPTPFQEIARDGIPPYHLDHWPNNHNSPKRIKPEDKPLLFEKFETYLSKGYLKVISSNDIKSVIDYFYVPKGLTDVRVVFNGTSCGINKAVFASNFWLPMSNTMTRLLSFGYRCVDVDIGEMFWNFPLHPVLQLYSGVDLTPFRENILKSSTRHLFQEKHLKSNKRLITKLTRVWMGFKQSPEIACRYFYLAEEFIRGNHRESKNPLRWDSIKINLIGDKNFNPTFPNVYKWDERKKRIAGDLIAYVDDLRSIGYSMEDAWQITRRVCSHIQYLGIQDAARKRRVDEGPWAGGVYSTSHSKVTKSVTEEKWNKGKVLIDSLLEDMEKDPSKPLEYKRLERIRGFLCHLAMVYDIIFPYLKGFHLTLAKHLPHRNDEGWKMSELEWIGHVEVKVEKGIYSRETADILIKEQLIGNHTIPEWVIPVPRFKDCLLVLHKMFKLELPPVIIVRSTNILCVIYGFVDASGSGFGTTLLVDGKINYKIGTWSSSEDKNSSNWREFENLVDEVEYSANKGWLKDSTVLLATDNQVVEACLYKGNSSSQKLFELVVRLKLVELKFGLKLLVTHVSGKRMQVQGTDGVSRGSLKIGVTAGLDMIKFCPWSKDPLESTPSLKSWVTSWAGHDSIFLTPDQWFTRGHDIVGGYYNKDKFWYNTYESGTYIWSPPAAAADVCIEEIRKARMKRTDSLHIVLIHRLMTPLWLKQLFKASDCIFSIPASHGFWTADNFEPLTVALIFPYLPYRPFQLKGTPKMFQMGRELSQVFKEHNLDGGNILCKFLLEVRKFQTMPSRVVWKMLYFNQSPPFPCKL